MGHPIFELIIAIDRMCRTPDIRELLREFVVFALLLMLTLAAMVNAAEHLLPLLHPAGC